MNTIHGSAKWNQKWMKWIDGNPNATSKDISVCWKNDGQIWIEWI